MPTPHAKSLIWPRVAESFGRAVWFIVCIGALATGLRAPVAALDDGASPRDGVGLTDSIGADVFKARLTADCRAKSPSAQDPPDSNAIPTIVEFGIPEPAGATFADEFTERCARSTPRGISPRAPPHLYH